MPMITGEGKAPEMNIKFGKATYNYIIIIIG